jgi:hypothetical protein
VRVVKTEGRTKTYGLPEPPDDDGPDDSGPDADEDKLTENGKPPAEHSDESGVESSAGPSTADTPENLSSPSPPLYRSGDGDDTEEGGAESHPEDEVVSALASASGLRKKRNKRKKIPLLAFPITGRFGLTQITFLMFKVAPFSDSSDAPTNLSSPFPYPYIEMG